MLLFKRILFGTLYCALVVFSIKGGIYSFATMLFVFSTIILIEYSRMSKTNVYVALSLNLLFWMPLLFFDHESYGIPILILGIASSLLLIINLLFFPKKQISKSRYLLLITRLYVSTGFLCLFLLSKPFGVFDIYFVLHFFILIWLYDSFAFVFGTLFGKTKLLPHISPKKSIEGAIGGLLIVFLYIGLMFYLEIVVAFSLIGFLFMGFIVLLFSTLGDLIESKIKRSCQVKDSSSFLPGHGGFFDRLDSVVCAAPFTLFFIKISTYVS